MLNEAERTAILRYVATLRRMAHDDKLEALSATSPKRRAHHLAEHHRRLREAWRWRRREREFRRSTIMSQLLHSQLQESVRLEATA